MINAVSQPSAGAPMPPSMSMPPAPAPTPFTPPVTSMAPQAPIEPAPVTLPPFEPPVNETPASQPPKKKGMPMKGIIGLLILILTVVGGGAALYLSQSSQDIRQQASVGTYPPTPAPTPTPTPRPVVPSSCGTAAVQCRTYDCPDGLIGNECRTGLQALQSDTDCPPPSSGCGQIDYDTVADGGTDNYCGHNLYTDCPPGGGTNPPGGGPGPETPGQITPIVACTGSTGSEGTFTWTHDASVEKYILRIDKENSCPGNPIGWFCGTNEGFPNNTGDQYYLLNATDVCSNGSCSVVKTLVPNALYKSASIQWVQPGGSTDANGDRMGVSPAFTCATNTPLSCGTLIMTINGTPAATAKYGDTVHLSCMASSSTPPATTQYSFYITEPGQAERLLTTSTTPGYDYNVNYTGAYAARCDVN